jgi:hypothetical protein
MPDTTPPPASTHELQAIMADIVKRYYPHQVLLWQVVGPTYLEQWDSLARQRQNTGKNNLNFVAEAILALHVAKEVAELIACILFDTPDPAPADATEAVVGH